jgi:hypothetical protein
VQKKEIQMDGSRFVVAWHVHSTLAANAIFRYKMPCNATLVQVDTCGTAAVTSSFILGTLLPTSDDNGYIMAARPGHTATFITFDRGDFDGALNPDTAECPHILKDTVLLLTYTHASASDVDIALTFLEG